MIDVFRVAVAVLVVAVLTSVAIPAAALRRPSAHLDLPSGNWTTVGRSVAIAAKEFGRLETGQTWMADESPFGVRPDFAN